MLCSKVRTAHSRRCIINNLAILLLNQNILLVFFLLRNFRMWFTLDEKSASKGLSHGWHTIDKNSEKMDYWNKKNCLPKF
jgi:hypothetical protein